MVEEPQLCTTSGRPVDVVRAEQTESTGQYKDYIVLCPDERAKGFVRPYRDAYIHVGRINICGKRHVSDCDGHLMACVMEFGHAGECTHWHDVSESEAVIAETQHRLGGCGVETKMGQALSETYARDPMFYGATFCVGCNKHLPVGEFVWTADGETVGS